MAYAASGGDGASGGPDPSPSSRPGVAQLIEIAGERRVRRLRRVVSGIFSSGSVPGRGKGKAEGGAPALGVLLVIHIEIVL
jgi:hypothetical protein